MLNFILSITPIDAHDKILYIYETFEQELLNYTSTRLYLYYESNVHSIKEDTEDIVYNTLAEIALNINRIDLNRPKGEIRAYVYTILKRIMYDYFNYEEPMIDIDTIDLPSDDFNFTQKIINDYENEIVKEAIRSLPEPYNTTLYLRYVENMKVEEIAKITNKAQSTIYSRLTTGKDLLEVYLKNKGLKINE